MGETKIPVTPDNLARIVMLAFGNMETGNSMYWAYVAVKPSRYEEFRQALAGRKYNIQNFVKDEFGEVVVSGVGGVPPKEVTKQVADLFGVPINQLFADIDPMNVITQGIKKIEESEGNS